MANVQIDTPVSTEELLRVADRLTLHELLHFNSGVTELVARRLDRLSPDLEPVLIPRAKQTLPESLKDRLRTLGERRDAQTLSPLEHEELIRLSDEVERREGDRLEAIAILSALKGQPLTALVNELGLEQP